MKKLFAAAVLGLLFLGSCAQKEQKREEFKDEYSAEHMRNVQGDSAVSATAEIDSTQTVQEAE